MPVALKPVTSSQIAAIGYDLASRTLAVRFTSGAAKVYHYQDVPPETAEALETAESVGKYFHAHIRGKFQFTAIQTEDAPTTATT